MKRGVKEFWVGLFVLVGFIALAIVSLRVGNLGSQGSAEGYQVSAKFQDIGGLTSKSPVRMSGVTIGRVTSIAIDSEDYEAIVTMQIFGKHNNLPSDTSASILTSGLLGSQYIGLEPGAEDEYLVQGSKLEFTQSALVLEKLIGRFITSMSDKK
jgi:phospholipid/cholesterol/gamma-HCH transport system substrate-binding protein